MLHYTAYVCLTDIDVKQTYSRFHADSDAILGKDGIMLHSSDFGNHP